MDDLVAWLTQIWDERQKAAERWDDHIAHWGICSSDAPDLSEEFARIAADRQILALHSPWSTPPARCHTCVIRGQRIPSPWPCPTVRLLAQPYADRPGFREEWRVTA